MHFRTFKYAIIGFIALIFLPSLEASPLRMDIYGLLRSARWKEVRQRYGGRPPRQAIENYAMAQALLKRIKGRSSKNAIMPADAAHAMGYFVRAMGYACPEPGAQSQVLRCLSTARTRSTTLSRLSIYKASQTARKYNWYQVEHRLLSLADFRIDDPLNARILADYLQRLHKNRISTALSLAHKHKHLHGAMLDLWRARIFLRAGQKQTAFPYLVRATLSTEAYWIEKAILVELRRFYAVELKNPTGKMARQLTAFSPAMSSVEIRTLQKVSSNTIIHSTNARRLRNDGIFLIKAGRSHALILLAKQGYSRLHQKPDIMHTWALEMKKAKESRQLIALLKSNHTIMAQHAGLWQIYLDLLQSANMRQTYFQETLKYLNKYPSHYSVQDHLITFLIGKDSNNIHWAHDRYWRRAMSDLPHHTGSGRFVYWLKRYFSNSKKYSGVNRLNNHFYRLAPGSFYAGAFWDSHRKNKAVQSNFIHDWQRIRSRQQYLQWLSRHGGKTQAVQFMKRRNRLALLDADAVRLWKDIQSERHRVPESILSVYRVGEWRLGHESLLYKYGGQLHSTDNLARLSYIGRATGALDYSVYYTRQLARARGVAEDPFGMPAGMLRVLYPRPYRRTVIKHSRKYGVKESQVYALMRQESLFREQAISRSGAQGLMQIMPRTGSWLASRMGIRNPDYMHPDTNIQLGSKYFGDLIKQYGDFRWASIAYNGGPGNLRRWKDKYYSGDFYYFLEHLPKEESRNYCRITYQNFMHYETTYTLYP